MTQQGTEPALPAPFRSGPYAVRSEWIDENDHLNLAHYVTLFDSATDALWRHIGLGDPLRAQRLGTFAAEAHILYRAELLIDETVFIGSQLLSLDTKRLHVVHEMRRERDGQVSAQQELMYLCVDLDTRRVAPWPDELNTRLRARLADHADLAVPDWVGRRVAMPTPAEPAPHASTPPSPA